MFEGPGPGLFQFTLNSGRVVQLDDLHIALTYAGLLEGIPDAEYNERLVQQAIRAMVPIWGERPTYLCSPKTRRVTEAGRSYERLPELRYHAWLTSHPMDPRWCDSEVVAIWYGPKEPDVPVRHIVIRDLKDLPWEQCAQDLNY